MAINLRKITEDDLGMIMNWRMSESVTRFMNTNPKLTIDMQREWFESISSNDKARFWLVEVEGEPAGIVNLIDTDWEKGNTSWGYYIGEEKLRSLKLAISLEMSLYDYCFDVLGFNEVHNEVFKLNEGVWKLHIACGNRIVKEEPNEIEKEGKLYDVIHLSIEREEWLNLRKKKNYERINYDIFQDELRGMKVHHIGVAVADIRKSIEGYRELGWKWDGLIIDDSKRGVRLAFINRSDTKELVELVSPLSEDNPVSNRLKSMRNVATPYHICYQVRDIDKTIEILRARKYILTEEASPAIAFNNRRVAFLLRSDLGLIELLEEE